jgi:hypothetical protein
MAKGYVPVICWKNHSPASKAIATRAIRVRLSIVVLILPDAEFGPKFRQTLGVVANHAKAVVLVAAIAVFRVDQGNLVLP